MDKYIEQLVEVGQKDFQRIYNHNLPKSEHVDIVLHTENKSELLWEYYDRFDTYRKQNKGEMWHFHYLGKSRTGLPVIIFVDNAHSYKRHNHQLWMYFQNNYDDTPINNNSEVLPISVEKNPRLLVNQSMLNISSNDLNKIIKFVKLNRVILTRMANGTIRDDDFYWKMDVNRITLDESFEKMLLIEMAKKVEALETGLTVPIWLDESQQYLDGGHGPRIKFESIKGTNSDDYSSMTIEDDPKIIPDTFPKYATIKPWEINLVKKFVIYNKDLLLSLINRQMEFEEFKLKMIKIDKKTGKPIHPQQQKKEPNSVYKPVRKTQFGLTMVMSNPENKYNFVNNNQKPISQTWFDQAEDFLKYKDGTIAAKVLIDNNWHWLYNNGTTKSIN